MIGEAWATGCADAAISLEWMQCEQIPIPVPRPGYDEGRPTGYVVPRRDDGHAHVDADRWARARRDDEDLLRLLAETVFEWGGI